MFPLNLWQWNCCKGKACGKNT